MGPSIVTIPFTIQELFGLNGEDMNDYLQMSSLDPLYRIYFHDKSYIDYTGNADQMKAQISKFNEKMQRTMISL